MNHTLELELYHRVFLIRCAEEAVIERYMSDEMKTPVHLSLGQEAISAGVVQALSDQDRLVGTYRSHGIYLARTLETDRFFAELYGRQGGIANGRTGSMHLSSSDHGFLGSSAVVASAIPVGVGAALAARVRGEPRVVAIFFGDGAIDEGVFYESLNFACLKKLPVLFVCEDNDLAIHSRATERHGYERITDIVSRFHCTTASSESTLASEVYRLASHAVDSIRRGGPPVFLHLRYYRYLEHVGTQQDFRFGYRAEDEYLSWLSRDPVVLQRALAVQASSSEEVSTLEEAVRTQVHKSIARAEASPFPPNAALYEDL